ncbi:MAG TPA: NlpC/P60 family protein [Pseudonocardiaceae bacterium]|nr:NlpC/P60 family protein [Pseudonocardiaceae bacterium]
MASNRLNRTIRAGIAAAAVLTTVALMPTPASADPSAPPPSNDPVAQFKQLSQQADALNEKVLAAQNDLNNKQGQLSAASAALGGAQRDEQQAQATINKFRGQADSLAAASFEGGNFTSVSALFTGVSAQDFLERESLLQDVANDNTTVLNTLQGAYDKDASAAAVAQHAQQTAQDATNAAAAVLNQLNQQKAALLAQESQVKAALNKLTSTQRGSLLGGGDMGTFIAPPGLAGEAMSIALGERGVPYVWGGASPSGFDCSGLVMWAYAHVGVSLPHSSDAQSQMGQEVSRGSLQAGDLVFFGSPVHHVGIYVGNGEMVDAPTEGEDVRVEPLDSDFVWGRRLSG